ncbi:hypothetical protein A8709_01605 [Paenibacillus pectinilyticus]|uniref:Uncharacterized protein n=1 Tax=Paenibacillus pectinilyticus TaxID=512399 RepID=A0A1C1A6H8_9BACL|nr:hypothetical protein A8709_01605 [Paenibacillus pectinilyticus]
MEVSHPGGRPFLVGIRNREARTLVGADGALVPNEHLEIDLLLGGAALCFDYEELNEACADATAEIRAKPEAQSGDTDDREELNEPSERAVGIDDSAVLLFLICGSANSDSFSSIRVQGDQL